MAETSNKFIIGKFLIMKFYSGDTKIIKGDYNLLLIQNNKHIYY